MKSIPVGYFLVVLILAVLVSAGFVGLWLYDRSQFEAERAALRQIQSELAKGRESEFPPTQPDADTSGADTSKNPHHTKIVAIEAEADMPLSRIARLRIRDEGNRSRPYPDSTGAPHIGVGRNLRGNGLSVSELKAIAGEIDYDLLLRQAHIQNGRVRIQTLSLANKVFVKPLTEHDIHLLLVDDLKSTQNEAISVFGAGLWASIAEARREALLDVIFNLGLTRFKTFTKLIGAVKRKDWDTAANELLLSEAAHENPNRYFRNSLVLRRNNTDAFGL